MSYPYTYEHTAELFANGPGRDDGICVLELGGQRVFSVYDGSGSPLAGFLIVLYLPAATSPVRLDGGCLPRRNQIIQDEDGWIYGGFEFSPQYITNVDGVLRGLRLMAKEMIAKRRTSDAVTVMDRFVAKCRIGEVRLRRALSLLTA